MKILGSQTNKQTINSEESITNSIQKMEDRILGIGEDQVEELDTLVKKKS